MRNAERWVVERAGRQHGVVARRQALKAGVSASAWKRLVAAGRLEPVHPGVARTAGSPRSEHQRTMAAVLAVGPTSMASHSSAAWLWGGDAPSGDVEVTTFVRTRGGQPPGVVVHRPTDVAGLEPVLRAGIPTTNPLRTLVDLGGSQPEAVVEAALERFVLDRLVSVAAVRAALERHRCRGRSGCGALARVLERWGFADSIPDSELEVHLARFLRAHGLPPAVHHVEVGRYELDFAWPERRIALEVDGWEHHGSRRAFEHDRRRDLELAAQGWQVLRTTRRALIEGSSSLAANLSAVLLRRAS